ncbi:MAG: transglycosylase SLT domain-containing protein [Desulfobacteraceae bacterium]|nr:transglycosylase SLT domain-containing protein [Desulfobacteraceae bacterium]
MTYRINQEIVNFLRLVPSFLLFIVIFPLSSVYGQSLEPANFPSLISSLKISTALDFCGEQVPIKNQEVRERLEKELLLSLWDRPQVILWLKRSHRYLPHIEKMLKENGMPDDLKYVSIAESALRPHVGSGKGAIGFWQFMVETGRKYGLVINEYIDERRNLFASTRAAIKYLKELHKIFGSWTLTVAAFNMGEEGLMAEILEQNTNNYYQLYLPIETQRFIFRILSVKVIFSDPGKFGFKFTENDYYPPRAFDQVKVDCIQEMPIRVIAQAARTHFKMIKDLNPEIRGHYLTKGVHKILIPKGASNGFQARYQQHVKEFLSGQKERIYIVKEGDNLSSIASRFHIPLPALIIWNRLDLKKPIHPGDHLIIYGKEEKLDKEDTEKTNLE